MGDFLDGFGAQAPWPARVLFFVESTWYADGDAAIARRGFRALDLANLAAIACAFGDLARGRDGCHLMVGSAVAITQKMPSGPAVACCSNLGV